MAARFCASSLLRLSASNVSTAIRYKPTEYQSAYVTLTSCVIFIVSLSKKGI